MKTLLSLCIPTNGVVEWVIPVLCSIYSQGIDSELFEVVVTDNGVDDELEKEIEVFLNKYNNIKYKRTKSILFNNQLDALDLAEGEFLKFINHRTRLMDGSLEKMIDVIKALSRGKPTIYFSNGAIEGEEKIICNCFDNFVKSLGIYASWTTGVGIWREDYERIPKDQKYDSLSPHSAILFSERKKSNYVIDNRVLFEEIETGEKKKGKYDLFKAFAVHELSIDVDLYRDGDISLDTLLYVKEKYRDFVAKLYLDYCLRRKECSYDLSGIRNIELFYTKNEIKKTIIRLMWKSAIRRFVKITHGKGGK